LSGGRGFNLFLEKGVRIYSEGKKEERESASIISLEERKRRLWDGGGERDSFLFNLRGGGAISFQRREKRCFAYEGMISGGSPTRKRGVYF